MAKKNNNNAEKYKTSDQRKKLCKQWCKHLSDGYSKDSFPQCDIDTFKRYSKKYPKDFDAHEIDMAERRQMFKWEKRLATSADTGKGNANSIKFGLENINKWENKRKHGYDPDAPPPLPPAPIINNHIDLSGLKTKDLKALDDIAKRISKDT